MCRTRQILAVALICALGAVAIASCGPVYTGLEGLSHMMPEDKVMRCPFCKKQIAQQDRRCPFCGRDVQFDLGSDAVDREARRLDEAPR